MEQIPILQDIVAIFGASIVVLFICHRLHIPAIVGFLLTGALIGPFGLGLIHSEEHVGELAEIGIILLLFTIGMEFSFRDLMRSRKSVLLGGFLQVGLTTFAVWLVAGNLGMTGKAALFGGFLVALSSTAIVLKSLQERAEIDSPHGRSTLAVLIFQDIIIVPMIIITPILANATAEGGDSLLDLLTKGILMVVFVFVAARWIVPNILYRVTQTRSRELFLLAVVLIGISVAWLTSIMGLSLGLGAFLAGLVISESEYSHQALEGVLPFRDVFTSFFFVSVGMLFNTTLLLEFAVPVIGATVGVLVLKAVLASGVGLTLGMSLRSSLLLGLGLSQIGEFSFILANAGLAVDLIDFSLYQKFIGVSVLTMAATPFIITGAPALTDWLARLPLPERLRRGLAPGLAEPAEAAPTDLRDHLIIVGFGINGRNLARVARSTGIPYRVIETNPDTVRRERGNGEPIEYGDATYVEVLRQAGIDHARILVIAISDPAATRRITELARDLNLNLYIIVRTRFVAEVGPLRRLGANEVIPEEFETSIEIFTRVLTRFLVPRDQIERFIADVRSDSYEMLRTVSSPAPRMGDLPAEMADMEITSIRVTPESEVVNRTLAELNLRARCGVTVLAIRRGDQVISNPGANTDLHADDVLYLLGSPTACVAADQFIRTGEQE